MTVADNNLRTPDPKFKSPLDRWLRTRFMTGRWLVDKTGLHESIISRARNGIAIPAHCADAIKKVTGLKKL